MGNARSSGRVQRSVDMPRNVGHSRHKVKLGEFLHPRPTVRCSSLPPRLLDKHADNAHLWSMTNLFPLNGIHFRVCPIAGN